MSVGARSPGAGRAVPGRGAASLWPVRGLDPAWQRRVLASLAAATERRLGTGGRGTSPFARALGRLSLTGCRATLRSGRLLFRQGVLFAFELRARADEPGERFLPVLVDPVTETAVPVPLPAAWLDGRVPGLPGGGRHRSAAGPPAGSGDLPIGEHLERATAWLRTLDYPLSRGYAQALECARQAAAELGEELRRQAAARLRADLEQLAAYYGAVREELCAPFRRKLRRLAVATVRAELARAGAYASRAAEEVVALQAELAADEAELVAALNALQEEEERRRAELASRCRPVAEIALVAAARLYLPVVELVLRLSGPVRRELVLSYAFLPRPGLVRPRCEACDEPFWKGGLCPAGDLLCHDCLQPCPGCGRPVCALCAAGERCALCGAPLCRSCAQPAPREPWGFPGGFAADESLCPLCAVVAGERSRPPRGS